MLLILLLLEVVQRLQLLDSHLLVDLRLVTNALRSSAESQRGDRLVEVVHGRATSDD